MPTVALRLDHAGRPVIALNVGVSDAARATLYTDRAPPASLTLRALIDTGASCTVIEGGYLANLGLHEAGEVPFRSASTGAQPVLAKVYAVSVASAEDVAGVLAADLEVIAAEDLSAFGAQVLLGRDILNRCVLHYDGPGRTIQLTFPPSDAP